MYVYIVLVVVGILLFLMIHVIKIASKRYIVKIN